MAGDDSLMETSSRILDCNSVLIILIKLIKIYFYDDKNCILPLLNQ